MSVAQHGASVHGAAVLVRMRPDAAVRGIQLFPPHHSRLVGAALVPLVCDANGSAHAAKPWHRDGAFRRLPAARAPGGLVPRAERPEFPERAAYATSVIVERHAFAPPECSPNQNGRHVVGGPPGMVPLKSM
jgi:hypothetical protein